MEVKEPISHYGSLDLDKEYSYLDYLRFTFSERVELIKGKIMKMSPAPSRKHQGVVGSINYLFKAYFRNKECKYYVAPFDVRLNIPNGKKNHTVVQPDLCVICDVTLLDDAGCNGTPDLIVEILSPSNQKHDLDTKFKLYEEAMVKEYWIVDPNNKVVLVYMLENNKFIGLRPFVEGSIIKSPIFPELKVAVKDVFEDLA
jgi:Uma2 family endonuclease